LTEGLPPPAEPGLVWCDIRASRVHAWRRPERRVRRSAEAYPSDG
jgi:sugar lactone lactonase YvrE